MSSASDSGGEEKTHSPHRSPSLNGVGKGPETATVESEEELLGRLGYKQVCLEFLTGRKENEKS
jgi:hypothetical protein